MATVYASLEPQTTVAGAFAHHRYYGLPLETALPRVLVSIQVVLQRVLNLTDQRVRRRLGVTREQLLEEDWRDLNRQRKEALTQALGRLAWEAEWEGLLVPAAAEAAAVTLI